ncbi:MAG: hypothetical protein QOJ54_1444 [Aliidongia sp.]|jgi:hypothetical protein|nr:hypothetical protein [Aliidongia sp.]
MTELRLARLPDRTPVKLGISVAPELHAALAAYADAYQAAYGRAESVTELIPFMLTAFIESDSGFRKARRNLEPTPESEARKPPKPRRRAESAGAAAPAADPTDDK